MTHPMTHDMTHPVTPYDTLTHDALYDALNRRSRLNFLVVDGGLYMVFL